MSQDPADRFLDLWERNVLSWWRDSARLLFEADPDDRNGSENRPEAARAPPGDRSRGVGRRGGDGDGGPG